MPPKNGRIFLIILALLQSSCVSFVGKSQGALDKFRKGHYEAALAWYQKAKPPRRDRLLYLLDEATILHTAGRYQESINRFAQAIQLSEDLSGPQVTAKTASVVTNDNLIPYQGKKFERLLMHLFQILNYLGLDQKEEALVEVRRIHTLFGDFFQKGAALPLRNAFATYLGGLVWEVNGLWNDAHIDYKKTLEMDPKVPGLKETKPPRGRGEIALILEEGLVPPKESSEAPYEFQIIPVPRYPEPPPTVPLATVSTKGQEVSTYPLYRVDVATKETLRDEMPGILARGLARLATKESAAVAVGKEVDEDLGFLVGFLLLATNRADLRSWQTLPRSFQIGRLSLPPGTYNISLKWPNGSRILESVEVKPRRRTFLMERIF